METTTKWQQYTAGRACGARVHTHPEVSQLLEALAERLHGAAYAWLCSVEPAIKDIDGDAIAEFIRGVTDELEVICARARYPLTSNREVAQALVAALRDALGEQPTSEIRDHMLGDAISAWAVDEHGTATPSHVEAAAKALLEDLRWHPSHVTIEYADAAGSVVAEERLKLGGAA